MPAIHHLRAERANLHGHWSRDLPPALVIDPGDTVVFECLEAGWSLEPSDGINPERRELPDRAEILDDGHALTGPVFIRGARPGQTLAVHIRDIQVGSWGTTFAGGWQSEWNDRLGVSQTGRIHTWTLDPAAGTARNQFGHIVRLRPFMGVYGLAPAQAGILTTTPPRRSGGNIDCKELVAGSTLYLPVEVEGGLFSTGDGHAAQGDGEISVTAIECPVERVEIRFDLLDGPQLSAPVANTPAGWVTMGFHPDLDEALVQAVEEMLALLGRLYGLDRLDALALASLAADFHITQAVNDVCGVHAVLPHGAIQFPAPRSA